MGIHRHWQFWLGAISLLIYYIETSITYTNPTGPLAFTMLFVVVGIAIYGVIEAVRKHLWKLYSVLLGLLMGSHVLLALYANGTFMEPEFANIIGSAFLLLMMNALVAPTLVSGVILVYIGMRPVEELERKANTASPAVPDTAEVFN